MHKDVPTIIRESSYASLNSNLIEVFLLFAYLPFLSIIKLLALK